MSVERLEEAVARTKRGIGIPLQSVVIDTYDDERFVSEYLGQRLKDRILASGGTMVARPDSGDPLTKPIQIISMLADAFGGTINEAGYFVLNPAVRVIQGDGINQDSIPGILQNMKLAHHSMDNLVLGMGGGMTHGPGRDEFSFSMKATARYNGKEWIDMLKEPKTDSGKKSLKGLVRCHMGENGIETFVAANENELANTGPGWRLYFHTGATPYVPSFDEVIGRATAGV
jgi:nicotinamide phosphoribosyltransferase